MFYLLKEEYGDYKNNQTGQRVNLLKARNVKTPGAIGNTAWKEFNTDDEAYIYYDISPVLSTYVAPSNVFDESILDDYYNKEEVDTIVSNVAQKNLYAFEIVDGELWLSYDDDSVVPDYYIDEITGELKLRIGEE